MVRRVVLVARATANAQMRSAVLPFGSGQRRLLPGAWPGRCLVLVDVHHGLFSTGYVLYNDVQRMPMISISVLWCSSVLLARWPSGRSRSSYLRCCDGRKACRGRPGVRAAGLGATFDVIAVWAGEGRLPAGVVRAVTAIRVCQWGAWFPA